MLLPFKIALYIFTITGAFFFGSWELKLKRQMTEEALEQHENVSDLGIVNDLSKRIRRARFLKSLPHEMLFKLRLVVSLKFLFVAIFIIEVIFLQR
jgi:hypothetical protein